MLYLINADGLQVSCGDETINLRGRVLCALCDELGANEVAGMKQSFGHNVKHFCRSCMFPQPPEAERSISTLSLRSAPEVPLDLLEETAPAEWAEVAQWTPLERALAFRYWRCRTSLLRHDILVQLEAADTLAARQQLSRDSGITGASIFDGEVEFDVCSQLPHDILHVVFEGGLLFHLKYLFAKLRTVLSDDQILVERVSWIASHSADICCFGRVSPFFVAA